MNIMEFRIKNQKTIYDKNEHDVTTNYYYYYQIAIFHNKNNKYHIRKIKYNEHFDIGEIKEYYVSKQILSDIINTIPDHKYKCYNVDKLEELPSVDNFILSSSSILNKNYSYSGIAPY